MVNAHIPCSNCFTVNLRCKSSCSIGVPIGMMSMLQVGMMMRIEIDGGDVFPTSLPEYKTNSSLHVQEKLALLMIMFQLLS